MPDDSSDVAASLMALRVSAGSRNLILLTVMVWHFKYSGANRSEIVEIAPGTA